jgi:hypothetical protein
MIVLSSRIAAACRFVPVHVYGARARSVQRISAGLTSTTGTVNRLVSGAHSLNHCQKGEYAAQCYDKGTGDSFSPSAPSILSNLSEAYFNRFVLSQQIVGCFHRLPLHLSDQARTTFMCRPNLPLCWHFTHSTTPGGSAVLQARKPRAAKPELKSGKFRRALSGSQLAFC